MTAFLDPSHTVVSSSSVDEVKVTRLQDRVVRLDGNLSAIYAQIQTMSVDGVLERVVSTTPVPREDGLFSVLVGLRPVLFEEHSAPQHLTDESQSFEADFSKPALWRSTTARRAVALVGLTLGSVGLVVALSFGLVWLALWLWALVLAYRVEIIAAAVLILGTLVWLRSRGMFAASPRQVLVSSADSPTIRADKASETPMIVTQRNWLTGRVVAQSVSASDAFASDPLTVRWLATMRDAKTGQAIGNRGRYRHQAVFENDRCGVGWLLHLYDPDGFRPSECYGTRHRAFRDLEAKYGKRFIKDVIDMNDRGVPLRKIADRMEPKLRKQGHIV